MRQYNFIAEVPSSSGRKTYTIKVDESGMFSCNCPSWIFNTRRNRTCKHIDSLRGEGLTINGQGRLITAVDEGQSYGHVRREQKIPIMCKNYPEQCDTCSMRFLCWTQREAEFPIDELRKAGIYKER